ncbi:MAG: type IX secretion system sortase PorU [Candidatus Cloacimonadota bacterium]|nr:type IX secretion system sortase PorU [Candidatus Cloacimonadota bacterium]
MAKPIFITNSQSSNLSINFTLGKYSLHNSDQFSFIDAKHLSFTDISGEARIPLYSFLVGIPQEGQLKYKIENQRYVQKHLQYPLAPCPKYIESDTDETHRAVFEINPKIYRKSLNTKLITLSDPFIWRNQRVVRVTICPFQIENQMVTVTENFDINFDITGNTFYRKEFADKYFRSVYENSIINFDVAKYWSVPQTRPQPENPFEIADRWFKIPISQDGIYKITKSELSEIGIDVSNLNPESIKIFNGSGRSLDRDAPTDIPTFEEIPVFINDNGSDFSIYFYARDTDGFEMNQEYGQYFNPYTPDNIYWLTYNTVLLRKNKNHKPHFPSGFSKREEINTFAFKNHLEEEKTRIANKKPYELIKWVWSNCGDVVNFSKEFNINVENLDSEYDQKISVNLVSSSYGSNDDLAVYLNNQLVGTSNVYNGTHIFSGDIFENGTNQLRIEIHPPAGIARLGLNYIEIEYQKYLKLLDNNLKFSPPEDSTTYTYHIRNVDNDNLQLLKINNFYDIEKISEYDYNSSTKVLTFSDYAENTDIQYLIAEEDGFITTDGIVEKFKPSVYLSSWNNENGIVSEFEENSWLRDSNTLQNIDYIIISPNSDDFFEKLKDIATMHSQHDSMRVLLVKLDDIYDEFSWGLPDVVAIQLFLKYAKNYYSQDPAHIVSYALLGGDGTNDYRNYESITGDKNKIPPFLKGETYTSASDDYFGMFTQNTHPEMMIGRLPCQTYRELETVVNKTTNYVMNPNYGFWRSNVILNPDDFLKEGDLWDEPIHTRTLEESCAVYIREYVNLIKLYSCDYPFDESLNKPEVTKDIIKYINNGASIYFYAGHGAYYVLGDEDYFRASRDIPKLTNIDKLTFFIASSCSVGEFDPNCFQSMAELVVSSQNGGAVASVAATRGTNHGFCRKVVKFLSLHASTNATIGQGVLIAKSGSVVSRNHPLYVLFGDPAIQLAIPPISGQITIPENFPDSIKTRQTAQCIGNIADNTDYDETFSVVFDSDYMKYIVNTNLDNNPDTLTSGDTLSFRVKGKPVFKGPVSVTQDISNLNFIVPDDALRGEWGRILSYSANASENDDIMLNYQKRFEPENHNLKINGFASAENDGPPLISCKLDKDDFQDGDFVSSSPIIYANISDSNGINITNSPGHRILYQLDDQSEVNITDYFVYDKDSYSAGKLEYKMENIGVGSHTLQIKAFDNFNKFANTEINFQVQNPDDITAKNVLNYPNPMQNYTYFTFYLDDNVDIDISIFTISGKLIKKIKNQTGVIGYNQIYWDGKDGDGDIPANGLYFYKFSINSKKQTKIFKLFIHH